MRAFLAVFLIALTLTLGSIPWVRRAALALGLVDVPSQRKAHRTPTPLLGGTAIFFGAIVGVLLFYGGNPQPTVIGTVLAATVVALTGLIDDYHPLPAWLKLLGQVLGILILAYFGIRVRLPVPDVVNYAITLLWLLGITNAINFLDNMDGLTAGVAAVIAAFILLLALSNGQFLVGALSAGLLGACLGFLRYNFPRPKSSWAMSDRYSSAFCWRRWVSNCASPTTPISSRGWCQYSCSGCPSLIWCWSSFRA